MPELERTCEVCNGTKTVSWETTRPARKRVDGKLKSVQVKDIVPVTCHHCKGLGTIKTEAGEKVFDFLMKYLPFSDQIIDMRRYIEMLDDDLARMERDY